MGCFIHKWNGCVCTKCGKTRDEGHDFQKAAGKCVAVCARCGKEQEAHAWDGCVCKDCGKARNEAHQIGEDGFCVKCGAAGAEPYRIDYLSDAEKSILVEGIKITQKLLAAGQPNAWLDGALKKMLGHYGVAGTVKLDVFDVDVMLQSIIPNVTQFLEKDDTEANRQAVQLLKGAGEKLAAHKKEIEDRIAAHDAAQ